MTESELRENRDGSEFCCRSIYASAHAAIEVHSTSIRAREVRHATSIRARARACAGRGARVRVSALPARAPAAAGRRSARPSGTDTGKKGLALAKRIG
jgi:hypothetical protein